MIAVSRRTALATLSAAILRPARAAASWPSRPITLLTGYAPGGSTTVVARIVGEGLSRRLGKPVVVESKPGAAGTLASALAAHAAADGHTLLVISGGFAATAAVYRKLSFRPVDDFSTISMLTEIPLVIATYRDHAIRSMGELIEFARAGQRRLLYGTPGTGSSLHLAVELLANRANAAFQHVPYRGGSPAIIDLIGGRLDFVMDSASDFVEFFRDGSLRPLAVTGATRDAGLPDAPTVQEAGVPDYTVTAWHGLVGPAGLPAPVMEKLGAALADTLIDPAVVDRLKELQLGARPSTAAELKARIEADILRWQEVVRASNIERI